MTTEIVQIREDHIESYHAVLGVVARERRYLAFVDAPPIESAQAYVRGNIAKGNPHLVAVEDGRVVGWCDVTRRARDTMRHCGVLGMGLSPDRRGRGLGRELMQRTLEAARAIGLARVELAVRDDNVAAQTLYRKLGFEVEGRCRRAMLVDGTFHDLILMAVLFDAGDQVSDSAGRDQPSVLIAKFASVCGVLGTNFAI